MVAPTGSGKTLSAFLWALDRLASEPAPAEIAAPLPGALRLPLKALAVDVERNLRAPLTGIGHAASRLGLPQPQVSVGVRSGDTPANERRAFARTPTDVLITTPESLFLLLTSQAREALAGVQTVILDEVHAVAGTKRGAHLALSLERLDALLAEPAQRIGLSATVRPVDEVARSWPAGGPVTVVQPRSDKQFDLRVVVPVPDLGHARRADRRPRRPGRRRPGTDVHLAARRGARRRPDRRPRVDPGLRQLPPAGRAAHRATQRGLAGAPGRRGPGRDDAGRARARATGARRARRRS